MGLSTKTRPKIQGSCIHHYDIDENNVGVCRKCKTVRTFPDNSQLEQTIKKLSHHNYLVNFGIPKEILKDLKGEVL